MSDLSLTDLSSASELSERNSVSSCSSVSSTSSLSDSSRSSESSSSSHSDSSSSRANSSLSPVDSPLQSVQDYHIHPRMDGSSNQSYASGGESRNQSTASEGEAASPSDSRSSSIDVAQMLADIGSINRYCEDIASQIDILENTSTPTIVRGTRRRLDVTPVEVIDLSSLEFIAPARPHTNRAPDAVIDLCTPDRSHTARHTAMGRRSNPQQYTDVAIVDVDDGPSPPKRKCSTFDQSQREDSYKCPVCLESVRLREPVSTKCGHVFCKSCLIAAIRSLHKCPLCNKKLTERQFNRIYL